MAYVAPSTRTTGEFITAAIWNQDVKDNVIFLANPPACRVFHSVAQSIADATFTVPAFNSERFDTDAMHDTVTNNSRITFNTTGVYVVTFHATFAAAADYDTIIVQIRLNGTTILAGQTMGDANDSAQLMVTTTYKFVATDYVEARVYQNNTANVARNLNSTGNESPEFSAVWIGLG